jgi:hypothetical protein
VTADECHKRAAVCAAHAESARDAVVASEFRTLAVHWSALAIRDNFINHVAAVALEPPAPSQ